MRKKLKLFVWEEIMCDWTCGIAFALAYDADHARELIMERARKAYASPGYVAKAIEGGPYEVTNPEGFLVPGGS